MYRIIGGDGNEYGPVSAEELQRWLSEGRVNGRTKTQAEGEADWRPLSAIVEFAGLCPPPLLQPQSAPGSDAVNKVIPYRNIPALAGYYCGVFALIPLLGIVLGLIALGLGIVGLRVARSNPAAGGKVHAWIGIVLGGLCGFGYLALLVVFIVAASRH